MNEIVRLDCIDVYNKLYGFETKHPLVAVVDLKDAKQMPDRVRFNYGLYALFLKNGKACSIRYGRQNYDYQQGTVVSFAPGQMVEVEMIPNEEPMEVYGLLFHPDLIYGSSLAKNIHQYAFFDYAQNEALHLSETERGIFMDCLKKIDYELSYPVDKHSRELLTIQIELILDYCLRFYDRQFYTRSKVNSDVFSKFESLLNDYFHGESPKQEGLPSVRYFADRCCLSAGYFGDLIKKETGRSAQEYIQKKIVDISKSRLLSSENSVSEVAYALGFQYPQHFIRLFKRETGFTPGEFRTRA